MSVSTLQTITMNGNSTGYGSAQGSEIFNLQGYDNTVLLAGAQDTVNVLTGAFDSIDLNSTGFTGAVTDVINLGASAFDSVLTSHALMDANVSVTAAGGPQSVSLLNVGGTTSVSLGYVGDPALEGGKDANSVTLNGDATNSVNLTGGGYATVDIGQSGDQFTGYASAVTLSGVANTVTGGDEAFSVSAVGAQKNVLSFGNGNSNVAVVGYDNLITFGNGANTLSISGQQNTADFGTGNNTVLAGTGRAVLNFAAADAGANETVVVNGSAIIHGGNQNYSVNAGAHYAVIAASLGNGNNTITEDWGNARLVIGTSVGNTGHNSVTLGAGGGTLTFTGGQDVVSLADPKGNHSDKVTLNGTMLGTQITAMGAFNAVTLTQDANATINDVGTNSGLGITLVADATGSFGSIAITGLGNDDLAQIHVAGASAYSITTDNTPVGGITLHFAHGSVDLVGLSSVPNNLING